MPELEAFTEAVKQFTEFYNSKVSKMKEKMDELQSQINELENAQNKSEKYIKSKKEELKVVFYPNQIETEEQIKEANTWPVLAWYLYDDFQTASSSHLILYDLS